ncbi:MAG: class I SAM-dependent methyltransferase [Verrucomicrobiota bacterium]
MKPQSQEYGITSKYYDQAYAAKPNLVDAPFYLELAKEIGGPVLELGCGTGRILLPIARAGIRITGLDVSEPMLTILKDKLADEEDEVRSKVDWVQDDIRTFRGLGRFPLVTVPFRAMQHMYTIDDQVNALVSAKESLSDDGLLAFDVFNPKFDKIFSGVGEEFLDFEWNHDGRVVKRFFRKDSVDKIGMSFTGSFIFRTYEDEKVVNEEIDQIQMSFYTYPHLMALFRLAGLEVVENFGGFSKEALTAESPEMIFLLKRKRI